MKQSQSYFIFFILLNPFVSFVAIELIACGRRIRMMRETERNRRKPCRRRTTRMRNVMVISRCNTDSWHAPEISARLPRRLIGENQMENTYYHQCPSTTIWQLRLQMSLALRVLILLELPHGVKNGADFPLCATRPKDHMALFGTLFWSFFLHQGLWCKD